MKSNPLVSVVVMTYNSSDFVIETLESIKSQTYKNIELIITDDCSQDSTIKTTKNWISRNKKNFLNTVLITSEKNTGIAPNLNRGIKRARGTWIKPIAGDDVLVPTILQNYLKYLKKNDEIRVIHSDAEMFKDTFNRSSLINESDKKGDIKFNRPTITPQEQFQILLRYCPIKAPTVMIKKDVYSDIGLYDERAPFWEDTPMWLKITKNDIKIHYLNIVGAKYRRHEDSIQIKRASKQIFSKYRISKNRYYKKYLLKFLPLNERILRSFLIKRDEILMKIISEQNFMTDFMLRLTGSLPQRLINKINKKFY